jgi:cytochrome c peroxidase
MKVPTLRNVDRRPFPGAVKAYMHNGVFKSLEEVVRFYNTRDVLPTCEPSADRADWGEVCWPAPEVAVNVNTSELGDLGLTLEEEAALVAFLTTLTDGFLPGP